MKIFAHERGFTLIEAMVVLALFGMLSALAAANLFGPSQQTNRDTVIDVFFG